jgi:hypothetical protein
MWRILGREFDKEQYLLYLIYFQNKLLDRNNDTNNNKARDKKNFIYSMLLSHIFLIKEYKCLNLTLYI